jgi:flagellar basal-body rod modification protein FlgD
MVDIAAAISSAQQVIGSKTSSSLTGASTVADSFDTFLSLLTTQLKHQDPTKPLDTNEFTQQLIQYTEVEQLLQSNKKLEAMLKLSTANTSMSLINYVGKEITTKGDTINLGSTGSGDWALDAPKASSDASFVVTDANGNEVYSISRSLGAGSTSFSWDGTTSTGSRADPGNYTLTVTAKDADDEIIVVESSVRGLVDGVDMSDDVPVLLINGKRFDLSDISEIHIAS